MRNWNKGVSNLKEKFLGLPKSDRAKIVHSIIMYKSQSTANPFLVESEMGRFQILTLNCLNGIL